MEPHRPFSALAFGLILALGLVVGLPLLAPVASADPVWIGEDAYQICVFTSLRPSPLVCIIK